MSRIDGLIEQLCPNGVEFMPLAKIAKIVGGRDYKHLGDGDIPVYGSGGVMAHVGTSAFHGPSVLLPRKGSISNIYYVEGPFWIVDTVFYTIINQEKILPRFLYHYILNEHIERLNTSNAARPALTRAVLEKIKIPIPPIEIQKEIVQILDSFTELKAELEAELENRTKQYSHYRKKLLTPMSISDFSDKQSEFAPLGTIAEIGTGSHDTKDGSSIGNYPFYARGSQPLRLNSFDYDETAIITAGDGAGVGKVFHYVNGKYALHQRAYRIVPNQNLVDPRYLFHFFCSFFYDYIMKAAVRGSVVSIRRRMLDRFPIYLPPVNEQRRIVSILDKFDALVNDLSSGIPAEIEARRKQYEYYRDKLLTFKEKPGD